MDIPHQNFMVYVEDLSLGHHNHNSGVAIIRLFKNGMVPPKDKSIKHGRL